MHLNPGTLLQGGKYRIVRFIKSGGFGCTYEALHTVFGERVAIKEFFPKDFCNRDSDTLHVTVGTQSKVALVAKLKSKFVNEAVAIHNLSHAGIVKVSDIFEENGTAYYVMDYIDGCSLDDVVKRNGALSEKAALTYIRQVCSALDYVHSRNRLHLDIKPGNIMIDGCGHAILIDFGASKQYDEVNGENTSTLLGMTPGYAPLEQYKRGGVQKFDAATDIYSLGATLYKLLTGQTPPDADEVNEDGLPPLPSSVSRPVRAAVEKAMSPRRKDRPQSVVEFMSLLEQPEVPDEGDETVVIGADKEDVVEPGDVQVDPVPNDDKGNFKKWLLSLLAGSLFLAVLAAVLVHFLVFRERLLPQDEDIVVEESVASYKDGILRVKDVEYPMVYVSGGSFMMGSDNSAAYSHEKPVHRVNLSSYRIGKYEVTQELWEAVMGSNPSHFKGSRRPVEYVSWDDCQTFIRKLNSLTGQTFKLPTEAQWEFAARGGNSSNGYKYSGSNYIDIDSVAWYDGNSGDITHDVGTKSPNELGIYDMSGNVWEWCHDWYGTYSSSSQVDPDGPSSGSDRVYRGGCWSSSVWDCRVSNRNYASPGGSNGASGLRLCL